MAQPGLLDLNGAPLGTVEQPAPAAAPMRPPVEFAPMPEQPPASETLSLLSALAGLGLNIAGAATGAGAAGNQSLQFAQQQQNQLAQNRQQEQRFNNNITQSKAVVDQARKSNISKTQLETIEAYASTGDADAASRELDRSLSELRRRDSESKAEKQFALNEALGAKRQLDQELRQHPGAVESAIAGFSDSIKDAETVGNIQARLQTTLKKQGVSLTSQAAKDYARQLAAARDEAVSSRKTGGFLGFFQNEAPPEQVKRVGDVVRNNLNQESLSDFENKRGMQKQLNEAVQGLRAKPGTAKYAEGLAKMQALAGGQEQTQQEQRMVTVELDGQQMQLPENNVAAARVKYPKLKVIR